MEICLRMNDDSMSDLVVTSSKSTCTESSSRQRKNEPGIAQETFAQLEQNHASHKVKFADSETKTAKIRLWARNAAVSRC